MKPDRARNGKRCASDRIVLGMEILEPMSDCNNQEHNLRLYCNNYSIGDFVLFLTFIVTKL